MNDEFEKRLGAFEQKLDSIFVSVEKTRKYFMWMLIITVAAVLLPLIGLVFAIPAFMSNYAGTISNYTNLTQ